jgi:hypothetical protein
MAITDSNRDFGFKTGPLFVANIWSLGAGMRMVLSL